MITVNINGLSLCHKGSGGVSHNTLEGLMIKIADAVLSVHFVQRMMLFLVN